MERDRQLKCRSNDGRHHRGSPVLSDLAIALWDPTGRVLHWNQANTVRNSRLFGSAEFFDHTRLIELHQRADLFLESPAMGVEVVTSEQPACDNPIGQQIGPYKLREKIGEGGFGVVYVAEQKEPVSRKVALKVIKPGMDSKDIIARFEAERQALAMMDHPQCGQSP